MSDVATKRLLGYEENASRLSNKYLIDMLSDIRITPDSNQFVKGIAKTSQKSSALYVLEEKFIHMHWYLG